jgi:hypothetical protein
MPLEFSVAAFRFGHTMVRAAYDHNRNFGRRGRIRPGDHPGFSPSASFDLLFLFTGAEGNPNPLRGSPTLPSNWIIEWDRFVDRGSAFPDHFARKIDTRLAPPLRDMVNQGNDERLPEEFKKILRRLARRNLLRGYLLSLPTGQAVAAALGVPPLSPAELRQGNSVILNEVLDAVLHPQPGEDDPVGDLLTRTPLWFYVLKEAEVRGIGNSLGEVGSRILCETIIGQLFADGESYLHGRPRWSPADGVKLSKGPRADELIVTIGDFLQFAGVMPPFPEPAPAPTPAETPAASPVPAPAG